MNRLQIASIFLILFSTIAQNIMLGSVASDEQTFDVSVDRDSFDIFPNTKYMNKFHITTYNFSGYFTLSLEGSPYFTLEYVKPIYLPPYTSYTGIYNITASSQLKYGTYTLFLKFTCNNVTKSVKLTAYYPPPPTSPTVTITLVVTQTVVSPITFTQTYPITLTETYTITQPITLTETATQFYTITNIINNTLVEKQTITEHTTYTDTVTVVETLVKENPMVGEAIAFGVLTVAVIFVLSKVFKQKVS